MFLQLSQRKIDEQTKGSLLGWGWSVLHPLLQLGVYTVVFGLILGGSFGNEGEGRFDFPLGIFMGLVFVNLINETLSISPGTVVNHANFVKKIVFPVELLPAAAISSVLHKALISLLLYLVGLVVLGHGLTVQALWLPLFIAPVILMAYGLGWALGAIGVIFRDSAQIVQFLTQVVFYASAVFYSPDEIPPSIARWLNLNPLLHAIELSRDVTLWNQPFDWRAVVYLWFCGFLTFFLGYKLFARLRPNFANYL